MPKQLQLGMLHRQYDMHSIIVPVLGLLASVATASLQIVPGATWTAVCRSNSVNEHRSLILWQSNTGQHIQAHGGGMLKVGEKWYWYVHFASVPEDAHTYGCD